jgi:nucleoside-diphosphate-sugar epimerase
MDAVIHLAADPTGYPEKGKEIMHVNVVGTYVVLDAARQAGVQRVFCASSINAFGTFFWRLSGRPSPYTKLPLDESFRPVPEDPYSLSKLCNEETCAAFHRAYGLTTAAFRFAGVWSAERYDAFRGDIKPTTEWSDLLYQWVHVSDLVAGIRKAMECPELPGFGVYTLAAADTCCPEPTMDLLNRFRPDLAATVSPPIEGRGGLLSIARARQTFGYAPRYRLGP